ncbi:MULTISPECIES: oxygenase MpaB family protein [unclassified Nocardia]|uniref:oxygenase MpaB family protein n=1 Tax=unclassified Nocardia TaxID=2637762 RepID=UPI0035DB63B5
MAWLLGVGKPTADQWRVLGESLLAGDERMDALVDWMFSEGFAETRLMFECAVRDGIDTVARAPEPLREFFAHLENPPEWLDRAKVARGARVFRTGGADGVYIARDVAFLGGYLASGFNKTLIRTGALEKGPSARFAETLQWALDVTAEGGMDDFGPGYRSTLHVRLIHALVRRHVGAMSDWDTAAWGVPINQTDMAATLVGALMSPFAAAPALGIVPIPRELDDAAHLTKYVGWLLGVENQWLPHGFRDAIRILYHCLSAITDPDDTTVRLARPMADDPLTWQYPRFAAVRREIARAQHLSMASAFLGPKAMHALGLSYALPWYPLLRIPINLLRVLRGRLLPGGLTRAAARGRREQEAFLARLIGSAVPNVGATAHHLHHAA